MNEAATKPSAGIDGVVWEHLIASDEVREFATAVRSHLSRRFPTAELLHIADGADPAMDSWDEITDLGVLSVGLPESLGGLGSFADLIVVLEEVGRSLAPIPVTTTLAAMHTLLRVGLGEHATAGLPIGLAVLNADEPVRVFAGKMAESVVVVAEDEAEVVVRYASVASRQIEPSPIDPGRVAATVELGAEVASVRIGDATLDDVLGPARVCVAADLVGVADAALEHSVAHALDRHQFGRPIGSFQAVKHQLADAHVALERARSLTRGAAAALHTAPGAIDTRRLTLLAKAAAAETALCATALRIQLLGAMGLTFESDSHLSARRANATAPYLGRPGDLYARAADMYLKEGR